jgi:broad specificity phosphatase PhoE
MKTEHPGRMVLVRHGPTEWSVSGKHTSHTDLGLLEMGVDRSRELGKLLSERTFAAVFVSPLRRALETCRLAGYAERAVVVEDLREWDYGDYEGRTTAEIRAERTHWDLWSGGVPNGETLTEVGRRADRVIARAQATGGDVVCFAHGHLLRVLAARWLGLPPVGGRLFALDPATFSELGWQHSSRVICRWNQAP